MPWLILTSATVIAGACASAVSELLIMRQRARRRKRMSQLSNLPKLADLRAGEIDWDESE
jgi:hypothetical protein